jgi:hypothetical protein
MTGERMIAFAARAQGWYYVVTGVWPILDIDSFQLVTGPKVDLWLVRTVAVLVTVIGATLLVAVRQRRLDAPIVLLAVGSALGLASIDIVYVVVGRIAPIYLLDAVAEIVLVALWAVGRALR